MDKLESQILDLRARLLTWYDAQGRALPWRIRPEDRAVGQVVDPYAVWLSEIMLQQTTVPHATPYWEKFLDKWPMVTDLANAKQDDVLAAWAGLGYYARARNLHKCAQVIRDDFEGLFPTSERELLRLPGIGPYTAATMAAICFNEPTNIVDGNVERVIARLFAEAAPLPKSKSIMRALAKPLADPNRPGDYGQALMDLGATVCKPKNPDCGNCVWGFACRAKAIGKPQDYPVKTKKIRPVKYGAVFALLKDGKILTRKRPEKGLLGGMLELPSTEWSEVLTDSPLAFAPAQRNWEKCDRPIRHIFTHFELFLDVYRARTSEFLEDNGIWIAVDDLDAHPVPTLTKKAILLAIKNYNVIL